jgi:D-alanyl-D-alanine endopeptidase (penicillin-binding protein 7)
MQRFLSFVTFIVSAFVFVPAMASSLALHSEYAIVVDRATGAILYEKSSTASAPIASVTKLMTAMVLLDQRLNPDEILTVTDEDVDTVKHSSSRLRVGAKMTREEMLRVALMSSENRAAHALARTSPGGVQGFVVAMNRKALAYGMGGTHYVDPTGLSPDNVSTATDLSKLARHVPAYPLITDYTTTASKSVAVGSRMQSFRNTNPAVGKKGWEFWLSKTGYITEAGRCIVAGIKASGRDVVVVLMGSRSAGARSQDLVHVKAWAAAGPVSKHRMAAMHAIAKPPTDNS